VLATQDYTYYCEMVQYILPGRYFQFPCTSKTNSPTDNLTIFTDIVDLDTNKTVETESGFKKGSFRVPFLIEETKELQYRIPENLPLHHYALRFRVYNKIKTETREVISKHLEEKLVPLYFNFRATCILVTLNKEEDTYLPADWVNFSVLLLTLSRRPITSTKYANIYIWKISPEYFLIKKWISIKFNTSNPVVTGRFHIPHPAREDFDKEEKFEIFVTVDERTSVPEGHSINTFRHIPIPQSSLEERLLKESSAFELHFYSRTVRSITVRKVPEKSSSCIQVSSRVQNPKVTVKNRFFIIDISAKNIFGQPVRSGGCRVTLNGNSESCFMPSEKYQAFHEGRIRQNFTYKVREACFGLEYPSTGILEVSTINIQCKDLATRSKKKISHNVTMFECPYGIHYKRMERNMLIFRITKINQSPFEEVNLEGEFTVIYTTKGDEINPVGSASLETLIIGKQGFVQYYLPEEFERGGESIDASYYPDDFQNGCSRSINISQILEQPVPEKVFASLWIGMPNPNKEILVPHGASLMIPLLSDNTRSDQVIAAVTTSLGEKFFTRLKVQVVRDPSLVYVKFLNLTLPTQDNVQFEVVELHIQRSLGSVSELHNNEFRGSFLEPIRLFLSNYRKDSINLKDMTSLLFQFSTLSESTPIFGVIKSKSQIVKEALLAVQTDEYPFESSTNYKRQWSQLQLSLDYVDSGRIDGFIKLPVKNFNADYFSPCSFSSKLTDDSYFEYNKRACPVYTNYSFYTRDRVYKWKPNHSNSNNTTREQEVRSTIDFPPQINYCCTNGNALEETWYWHIPRETSLNRSTFTLDVPNRFVQEQEVSRIAIDSDNGLRFFSPVKYYTDRPLSILVSSGSDLELPATVANVITIINNWNQTLSNLKVSVEGLEKTLIPFPITIPDSQDGFELQPYSFIHINTTYAIAKPGTANLLIKVMNNFTYIETSVKFFNLRRPPMTQETFYSANASDFRFNFESPDFLNRNCSFKLEHLSSRLIQYSAQLLSQLGDNSSTNDILTFFAISTFAYEVFPISPVTDFDMQRRIRILFENSTMLLSNPLVSTLGSILKRPDILQTMIDVAEKEDGEKFFFQIQELIYEMLKTYHKYWGSCYKKYSWFLRLAYPRVRYLLAFQNLIGSPLHRTLYTNKIVNVLGMFNSVSCEEDPPYIWWFENERINFRTKYADSNDPVEHFKGFIAQEINYMIGKYNGSRNAFDVAAITHLLDEINHSEAVNFFSQAIILLSEELLKKPVFKIDACEMEQLETCKLETSLLLAMYLHRRDIDMSQVFGSKLMDILEENADNQDFYTFRILGRFAKKYYKELYFNDKYQADACKRHENNTGNETICMGNSLVKVERQCYDIS